MISDERVGIGGYSARGEKDEGMKNRVGKLMRGNEFWGIQVFYGR